MRSIRWTWVLAAFAWILLLFSCSFRSTAPDRFPKAVRLHDVNPYRQDPEQCGPFALASLLQYTGVNAQAGDLVGRLYSPGAGGTLTMDLYLEARRAGLATRQLSGDVKILEDELRDHNPVVVLFRYPGLRGGSGHFILVTGYSSEPPGFFLLWGDGKLSWMVQRRFRHLWSGSGNWMLAVHGEGKQ